MTKPEAHARTQYCQRWLSKQSFALFEFASLVYDFVKNKDYEMLDYNSGLAWWLDNFPLGRRNYFSYKKTGKLWKKLFQGDPEFLFKHGVVFERVKAALPQLEQARTKEEVLKILEVIKTTERRELPKVLTPTLECTLVLAELYGGHGRISHIRYKKKYMKEASTQNLFEVFGNKEIEATFKLKKRNARKKRA